MNVVTETVVLMIVCAGWGLTLFIWIARKLELGTDRHWLTCAFLSCLGPMFIAFGWAIGIPPEGNALDTAVQCSLLLITALLTGPAVYVIAQKRSKYMFGATTAVHLTLCFAILLLPVIETAQEARTNFDSVRKVPAIVAAPCDRGSAKPLFADLSDIHIVSEGSRTTNDGSVPGNDFIPTDLAMVKALSPRYLIITGDVTDTGSADQWQHASDLLKNISETVEVVLTPGNHDQNAAFISHEESLQESLQLSTVSAIDPKIADYFALQELFAPRLKTSLGGDLRDLVSKAPPIVNPADYARAVKFYKKAVDECVWRNTSDETPNKAAVRNACMSQIDKEYPQQLMPITEVNRRTVYWSERKTVSFPLYKFDSDYKLAIFILGSALSDTNTIGANAIGTFDEGQIRNLASEIESAPKDTQFFLFCLHHPLTMPSNEQFLPTGLSAFTDSVWWANAFLRANTRSADAVLKTIIDGLKAFPAAKGFVLFGHRHKRSLGVLDGITFVEAPNVAAKPPNRGIYVGRLATPIVSIQWCETE